MTHGKLNFSERIEDYEISREPLGKGGFATVYKARCLKTGIEVAIKMINRRLTEEAGMVERVREEIKIHTRLKHPAIIELYTFFEDAQYVYLVLELAQNGELQRYFKKNHKVMNDVEASRIMRQVVEGLYYLHSQGILHRDLSLSNLLLSHDMHVKIGDFGLAKRAAPESTRKNFTMCGTPNYISPEVASRTAHGPPADIWGLGCMLYTLLVGKPPFDTETVRSTLTRIVMSDYVLPTHLSPEARDLIQRLLKKNPSERITLPDIMVHPFMTRAFPAGAGAGVVGAASRPYVKPMTAEQRRVLQQHHQNQQQQHQQQSTVASQDSGMHTMSSDGYSSAANARFGNSTGGQFGSCRSQSEECLTKPTSAPKQNSQYRMWDKKEYSGNSCYGSMTDITNKLPRCHSENRILTNNDNNNQADDHRYRNQGLVYASYDETDQKRKVGESSVHQEYCACDQPVCRARRKVYNDTKNCGLVCPREQDVGLHKQIDPGGPPGLDRDFDRLVSLHADAKKTDVVGDWCAQNRAMDNCIQETPRSSAPYGLRRADQESRPGQTNEMQNFGYQQHLTGQTNSYNGATSNQHANRGYEGGIRINGQESNTNSRGPRSRSSSQGRDNNKYTNKPTRERNFQYHSGDFRQGSSGLRLASSSENYSEDDAPINENIGVPPLNSARLQPTRHRTKNAILSITPSGEVVIEFIKRKGRAKEERVIDVCRISEDGLRIVLYQPDQGRGVPVRSEPPPLPLCGTDSLHGYETLPEQHCRKYLYAVRFINLVKAKTPKVTFYSRLAKCQLMETGADFEACFYEGGKISKNTVEGIKITVNDNCPYLCPYDQTPTLPTSEMRLMWEHFEECMSQCQRLNSLLSWDNPCGQNFPIVVGRRPAPGIAQLHNLDSNKENCPRLEPLELTPFVSTPSYGPTSSGVSAVRSEPPIGFAAAATASGVMGGVASSSSHRHQIGRRTAPLNAGNPHAHPTVPKTVDVPGIGIATQLVSGEVQVQYHDGAILTVPPMSPGAGVHYAVGGYGAHFRPEDDLPPKLRERLEKISTVIEHLKMAQPPTMAHIGRKRPGLHNQ